MGTMWVDEFQRSVFLSECQLSAPSYLKEDGGRLENTGVDSVIRALHEILNNIT